MPNFDFGKYFLTVLLPIRIGLDEEDTGDAPRSHVAAIREALAVLPPAKQSPTTAGNFVGPPFSHSLRTHFARLFVIDDLTFNGRDQEDVFTAVIQNTDPTVAREVDSLGCAYLVVAVEFDADSGSNAELEKSLAVMWDNETTRAQLRTIFRHCYGFENVEDTKSLTKLFLKCRLRTTMPYHDYGAYSAPPARRPFWASMWLLTVFALGAAAVFSISTLVTVVTYFWEIAGLRDWAFDNMGIRHVATTLLGVTNDRPLHNLTITGTLFALAIVWFSLWSRGLLPKKRSFWVWVGFLGSFVAVLGAWAGALCFWRYAAEQGWSHGFWYRLDATIFNVWDASAGEVEKWTSEYIEETLLLFLLLAALFSVIGAALFRFTATRPFPAPPNSTLPEVLKALYVQQRFTDFVQNAQGHSDAELYEKFGAFIAAHQPSNPTPTQERGVIRSPAGPGA